jgi:predicted permease
MEHDVRYSQNYSAEAAETGKPWMPQARIRWLEIMMRNEAGAKAARIGALNTTLILNSAPDSVSISNPEDRRLWLEQRFVTEPFGAGFSGLRQRFTKPLYALMAMAGLVLLIACANAANLLLARAAGRQREIAVRQSLGAGRLRLVQQLLTEGLVLVSIAAVCAVVIARWAGEFVVRMATVTMTGPVPFEAVIDMRVLAFTAAVALATGLLFALAPALRATHGDLTASLKAAARNLPGGGGSRHARALVVLQIALSLVLVTGTALLVRSFANLLHVDLGFEQEHVLSISINPGLAGYGPDRLPQFHQRLLERMQAVAGVRSVSLAMCGIVSGCRAFSDDIRFEGYQARPRERVGFISNFVSRGYFSTVGMRLVEGRTFNERDVRTAPRVAVVNEALVRRYFSGRAVIGQRFGDQRLDTEIVGVVRDARVLNVRDAAEPMVFLPLEQHSTAAGTIEVRTWGNPTDVAAAVRRSLAEAEPGLPISRVTALVEQISRNLSQERLVLSLTSSFGLLALGLASFGLFGVLSYAVARRTPELGIRIALGASPGRVVRHVVGDALVLIVAGLAIGFPGVIAGTRFIEGLLFDVSPHDWSAILGATVVLVLIPSIFALLPALKASKVDPAVALRQE